MVKRFVLGLAVAAFAASPAAFADVADYMLNINGTTYCPAQTGASCGNTGLSGIPGLVNGLDTTWPGGTGLGSLTLTYNPGPGTFNVNLWLFEQLFGATAQNEFGAASGTPGSGETWQIDVPDYNYMGELGSGPGTIVANTAASTLNNTNSVPGNTSNFDASSCGFVDPTSGVPTGAAANPNCNDYTSMALGFKFSLGSGEQEVINFDVSTTAPTSGFYLKQVAPVDPANSAEIDYYFSASATTQPVGTPPSVPEPSSWILMGTVAGLLVFVARKRRLAAE